MNPFLINDSNDDDNSNQNDSGNNNNFFKYISPNTSQIINLVENKNKLVTNEYIYCVKLFAKVN